MSLVAMTPPPRRRRRTKITTKTKTMIRTAATITQPSALIANESTRHNGRITRPRGPVQHCAPGLYAVFRLVAASHGVRPRTSSLRISGVWGHGRGALF